jgi:membrane associated rhomboid family serine protease
MTEMRPTGFEQLPVVIKNLLIINVLVYLAQETVGSKINLMDVGALHSWKSDLFKPWQLITYMFMHANLDHLLGNMVALWIFGTRLEYLWGPKRFLNFYIICGLGAALCHMLVMYFENEALLREVQRLEPQLYPQISDIIYSGTTVGASGAVMGCLAAFGYVYFNDVLYLYFAVPVPVKLLVPAYFIYEIYLAYKNSAGDNVAHFAHIGGGLFGFLLAYSWRKNNRRHYY